MKLKRVLKGINYKKVYGSKEVEISGISENSKLAFPNSLFLARRGRRYDGTDFILEAISCGAIAIVTDIYNPLLDNVVQVIVEDVAAVEADIAARYHDFPSSKLFVAGVTGTNGKTTTVYGTKHLLDRAGKKCGLLSSVEYLTEKNRYFSSYSTPDSVTCQRYLKEMVSSNCQAACLEVSSHGVEQGRVKNIDFDVAIFTNFSQDHLDYYGTMEAYFKAKLPFFSSLGEDKLAIINRDDAFSQRVIENTKARVLTYGIDKKTDIQGKNVMLSTKGSTFEVEYHNRSVKFSSPLIGKFNVYNLLAVISVGLSLSFSLEEIREYVLSFSHVPGRMERIDTKNFDVFIDFAHTPEALKNVLIALRSVSKGRIITVFGCGGDRDQNKRPVMGKICSDLADVAVVTSDNPRDEDHRKIIREIVEGFASSFEYFIEEDRKKAIEKAIKIAKKNDVVLIAGKGHESYQIFSDRTCEFNDKKVAEGLCKEL